jgi:hypothetical protein
MLRQAVPAIATVLESEYRYSGSSGIHFVCSAISHKFHLLPCFPVIVLISVVLGPQLFREELACNKKTGSYKWVINSCSGLYSGCATFYSGQGPIILACISLFSSVPSGESSILLPFDAVQKTRTAPIHLSNVPVLLNKVTSTLPEDRNSKFLRNVGNSYQLHTVCYTEDSVMYQPVFHLKTFHQLHRL